MEAGSAIMALVIGPDGTDRQMMVQEAERRAARVLAQLIL